MMAPREAQRTPTGSIGGQQESPDHRAIAPDGATSGREDVRLSCLLPWWLHPIALVAFVPLCSALLAISLPSGAYQLWGTPKFLSAESSTLLFVGLLSLILGLTVTSFRGLHTTDVSFAVSPRAIAGLNRVYRILFALTLTGYVLWIALAIGNGVGPAQLIDVLQQQPDAIGNLKSNARPVAGLTTLTQFGPMCVAIGMFLHRVTGRWRTYRLLFAVALVRAIFYAERLAIIELALPAIIVYSVFYVQRSSLRSKAVALLPVLGVPLLWVLFAVFEYFRSWAYYQYHTTQSFPAYISLRLVGYYATAYNNSALFDELVDRLPSDPPPYMSLPFVWNAPVLNQFIDAPNYYGTPLDDWVKYQLATKANEQFNNKGSFLLTHAEFGIIGMIVFWLIAGLLLGRMYSAVLHRSLPALLSYSVIVLGVFELPRIIYWTEGRAFPVMVSIAMIFLVLRVHRPGDQRPPPRPVTIRGAR
jgi:oligosaccharide repeat unit polymerase